MFLDFQTCLTKTTITNIVATIPMIAKSVGIMAYGVAHSMYTRSFTGSHLNPY